MSDAEKQDAIANILEVQGFPAHALTARQIAGRIRDIESALARIGAMFEPDIDEPEGRQFRSDVDDAGERPA